MHPKGHVLGRLDAMPSVRRGLPANLAGLLTAEQNYFWHVGVMAPSVLHYDLKSRL